MITISKPTIEQEELDAVIEVLQSNHIAHGKYVEEFEKKFARFIDSKYAVAVNNGTSALHASLVAYDIKEGDEIITTPFSFIATANSILMTGAKPVFVDINPFTFNIDEFKIEEKITSKTKVIMPVHLYGQSCNMDIIMSIAKKYNLHVIEDACQAHGAVWDNKKCGNFGIGCFSFYPTKNLMVGEGGMITTNDDSIYEKLLMIRNHGQSKRYYSSMLGYNYRMTNISASIGIKQLAKLDLFNTLRLLNAQYYNQKLGSIIGIEIPYVNNECKHVYHQYTIKITDEFGVSREILQEELLNIGIMSETYYPLLMPEQKHLKELGYTCDNLNNAMRIKNQVLSLPIHPKLTKEDLDYVINTIRLIQLKYKK